MAKQVIVDFNVKTGAAIREVQDLKKEIQKVNKEAIQTTDKTSKGLQSVEKSSGKAAGGVSKIGTALKGLGIGLIIAAFAKFTEVLSSNQRVADFFNTTFEVLRIAFNDFVNFVLDNAGSVVGVFKSIFENPAQSIKDFGTAIKNNLIERFNSFLDTLGFVASAVKKVFSGDFKGALEDVKSAGKESIDVLTGVDNSFDKTVETVEKVVKATTNYAKETLNTADANIKLKNSAQLLNAENQGLIEKYDVQAEQQRQIRDDTSKSIEERIAANKRLGEILDEQSEVMQKNAQVAVDAARASLKGNEDNIQLQTALQEALNERAAIQARVTGQRSEQLTNENALLEEQKELNKELALIGKTEREIELIELEQALADKKALIEKEVTNEEEKNRLLLAAQDDFNKKKEALEKESGEEEVKITELTQEAKLAIISGALGGLAQLAGENSKFGKGVAVAQAIIDTFAGANKAIAQGGIFGAVAAAGIIASGLANVKTILSTKTPNAPSGLGVGSSGGGVSVPTPQAPSFNVVGASAENQLAQTLADATQKPVKAFVVAGDVSTAQSLDRNIIQESSLG
tara:strand:- start:62 stop:1780 length:1719 start_codon:yes stop_codon:yes gene_type:complete